jgi:integral membrane protein
MRFRDRQAAARKISTGLGRYAEIADMALPTTPVDRLRFIAFWEGISFLLLLVVAMPLKYFAGWPLGVRVVGMAHGILFVLYVGATVMAARSGRWSLGRTALVLVASVLPAGPFIVDAKILSSAGKSQTGSERG